MLIHTLPAFNDNYIWLFQQHNGSDAVAVDPGDAAPVLAALQRLQLDLTAILVTHQHRDHIGGVNELLRHYPDCVVCGPADIEVINHPVAEGDQLRVLDFDFEVLAVPGHTLNHLAYITHSSDGTPRLFCGDTLFAGGCGRLFEGSPAQMHSSLAKLSRLPDNTRVYCAHEYTQANLTFAHAVEPDNEALNRRIAEVADRRAAGQATVPSTMLIERQTNPFLRAAEPGVRKSAERQASALPDDEIAVFAAIRRWKDSF